jgi:hypothetical protein
MQQNSVRDKEPFQRQHLIFSPGNARGTNKKRQKWSYSEFSSTIFTTKSYSHIRSAVTIMLDCFNTENTMHVEQNSRASHKKPSLGYDD